METGISPKNLHDAHCHQAAQQCRASHFVVNGTSPGDWPAVLKLAAEDPRVIPAIGLHPWQVNEAPPHWQAQFLDALPHAGAVGEIGLDQWKQGFDLERQQAAFRWQLDQAAARNLPVSIHCLKAGEALLQNLRTCARPQRGIHLHAYSGSAEQVKAFAEFGAYFSFHAGQFKANAKRALAAVRRVPIDRLLIETDAPSTLQTDDDAATFLLSGYTRVAELRGVARETLAEQVAANFKRYFLDD